MADAPEPLDPSFLICVREWLERIAAASAIVDVHGRVWWCDREWSERRDVLGSIGTHLPTHWARIQIGSTRLSWLLHDILSNQGQRVSLVGQLAHAGSAHSGWYQFELIPLPLEGEAPYLVVQARQADGLIEAVHQLRADNEELQLRLATLEQHVERDSRSGLLDARGFARVLDRELSHQKRFPNRASAAQTSWVVRLRVTWSGAVRAPDIRELLSRLTFMVTTRLQPRDEPAVLDPGVEDRIEIGMLLLDLDEVRVRALVAQLEKQTITEIRALGLDAPTARTRQATSLSAITPDAASAVEIEEQSTQQLDTD